MADPSVSSTAMIANYGAYKNPNSSSAAVRAASTGGLGNGGGGSRVSGMSYNGAVGLGNGGGGSNVSGMSFNGPTASMISNVQPGVGGGFGMLAYGNNHSTGVNKSLLAGRSGEIVGYPNTRLASVYGGRGAQAYDTLGRAYYSGPVYTPGVYEPGTLNPVVRPAKDQSRVPRDQPIEEFEPYWGPPDPGSAPVPLDPSIQGRLASAQASRLQPPAATTRSVAPTAVPAGYGMLPYGYSSKAATDYLSQRPGLNSNTNSSVQYKDPAGGVGVPARVPDMDPMEGVGVQRPVLPPRAPDMDPMEGVGARRRPQAMPGGYGMLPYGNATRKATDYLSERPWLNASTDSAPPDAVPFADESWFDPSDWLKKGMNAVENGVQYVGDAWDKVPGVRPEQKAAVLNGYARNGMLGALGGYLMGGPNTGNPNYKEANRRDERGSYSDREKIARAMAKRRKEKRGKTPDGQPPNGQPPSTLPPWFNWVQWPVGPRPTTV